MLRPVLATHKYALLVLLSHTFVMFWASHITLKSFLLLQIHTHFTHNLFFLLFLWALSPAHTLTPVDSEREEDRWHICRGEAARVICYNSALISIFSNLLWDLYVQPERVSITAKPWLASTAPVSLDRCFPWPPNIFWGHMGLSQAWLISHSPLLGY